MVVTDFCFGRQHRSFISVIVNETQAWGKPGGLEGVIGDRKVTESLSIFNNALFD